MIIKDKDTAIAIIPYGEWKTFNLSSLDLDTLEWPLGRPKRLMKGTLRDMLATDYLITFPRRPVFFFPRFKVKPSISLMIVEPDINHKLNIFLARLFNKRFYKVLTKNHNLLNKIDNGSFFYFGSSFIKNYKQIDINKSQLASIIASPKNDLEGHKLRHSVIKEIQDLKLNISILGRSYKPFKNKEDGLKSFMYSVIIENIREKDYFTEKIVDACLCNTVPIYWGAPNISDYFDHRGMIICSNESDIINALETITIDDYHSKLKWILKNKVNAINHANLMVRASEIISKS